MSGERWYATRGAGSMAEDDEPSEAAMDKVRERGRMIELTQEEDAALSAWWQTRSGTGPPLYGEIFAAGIAHERARCIGICRRKIAREAGYGGRFEGYGAFMGDKTGPECAAAIESPETAQPKEKT